MELIGIQALAQAVSDALAVGYLGPANGQIRAVPDLRSIRYYTTLGLLDPPSAMDGRTALYGERHIAQLVAIKRLQAEGQSLAQIQAKLQGISPRALAELAKLPRTSQKSRAKSRAGAFWKQEPVTPARPRSKARAKSPLIGIELGEVTLLVRPARTIDEADAALIREAAAPLLRALESRGLIAPSEPERNEG